MDYRYLNAFMTLSKTLHFSKAAVELRIATSALSRQIKLFEQSVGEDLFLRSNRSVALTTAGKRLFEKCVSFEESLSLEKKDIKVGCLQSVFEFFLSPKLKNLNLEANLEIVIAGPNELEDLLKTGKIDFAFTNSVPGSNLLSYRLLYKENLCLFSTSSKDMIVFSNFEHHYRDYLKDDVRIIKVNSLSAAIQLVQEGLGSGIFPARLETRLRGCKKKDLKTAFENIYLVSPTNSQKNQRMSYLKELLSKT